MVTESVTRLPWQLSKRVLPQHTDHGGVMWHGAYVGWLEEARVEALAAVGLPYRLMALEGLEMPVVRLEMSYKRALLHGDQVVLLSHALPPEGHCAFEAHVELVLVRLDGDRRQVLRRPPPSVSSALQLLTQGPTQ
jgi:acyl-CoA thioester hydrolase